MKQFNDAVGCGYFFDADNGLIGLGQFDMKNLNGFIPSEPLLIFWTSDGGKNWTQAIMPSGGTGRVTSIFMQDRLEGYASMYSNQYSIWKTTDGGKSWQDFTQGNFDLSTCIYATSSALVKTVWYGNLGGRSIDGGRTYSQVFSGGSFDNSNGIDFADDRNGIVTIGPGGGSTWITNDGGINWIRGGDLAESWSVYAVKGTKTFFAMPEDAAGFFGGRTLYTTSDGGQSWTTRFNNFPLFQSFTGHIAGAGNTLYVQTDTKTNQGLFRSDDQGATWVNILGPSNVRDTRFAVTGCHGEVVYAFDDQGWVWKTTDGGDGTLGFTPRIGKIESVKAGDTTLIPFYIDSSKTLSPISGCSGTLILNSDILTPFGFETLGTLSQSVSFDTLYQISPNTYFFSVKYKTPLQIFAFSTSLFYIRAVAYLTNVDSTSVTLGSIVISTDSNIVPTMCSQQNGEFVLKKECGESLLLKFMAEGSLGKVLSIIPNPAGNNVYVLLRNNGSQLHYELFDALGISRKNGVTSDNSFQIDISELAAGNYYLRISEAGGVPVTKRVVIVK
jgi:photosystem II stability/assembly factor-like uncharacterized protein